MSCALHQVARFACWVYGLTAKNPSVIELDDVS